MSVQYAGGGGGGGFFSRILPTLLGMAGTAVGGPAGGMIGRAGGNLVNGNLPNAALDIIRGIDVPQSAGNPVPDTSQFKPANSFTDNHPYFGGKKQWPYM